MQNGSVARSTVLSARLGLAQGRAELLELACRLMELLVGQAEPGHQGAKVENGSLGDTRGYRDRRLAQDTPHRWGIELANAVLPQQPRQRRLAQARRLGRGRRPCPQRQDPFGCHVITQREKLGVVTPELLADSVAQAHALLLQLLGQPRPLAELNHAWVTGQYAAKQRPIRAQPGRCDPGIAPVVLGPGNADAVAQAIELLGIDRVHGKAAVQQGIHHRPVRHLDRHRNRAWVASHGHHPLTEGCQTRTAVRELPLAHDLAGPIKQADLVLCRAPVDAGKPVYCLVSHGLSPRASPSITARAGSCIGARGATSYWASVVASLPGHRSNAGARGTGAKMVDPGRPARTVSLPMP